MSDAPLILWFRRDLRLGDHPMLTAAVASGRPLVPVFILDPETEALGAAPKFRLGLALEAFAATLARHGSQLILRRGPALPVLEALVAETGAAGVLWSRSYDATARDRDQAAGDLADIARAAVAGRVATLRIDYLGLKQSFTTENLNVPDQRIGMTLREGPFSRLDGLWLFQPLREDACKVAFSLDYVFAGSLLSRALSPVFDQIATTFVDAFVKRADAVYG
jgi:ribosome-associated toxin RatA of RatAB toxin-antitoxin module